MTNLSIIWCLIVLCLVIWRQLHKFRSLMNFLSWFPARGQCLSGVSNIRPRDCSPLMLGRGHFGQLELTGSPPTRPDIHLTLTLSRFLSKYFLILCCGGCGKVWTLPEGEERTSFVGWFALWNGFWSHCSVLLHKIASLTQRIKHGWKICHVKHGIDPYAYDNDSSPSD